MVPLYATPRTCTTGASRGSRLSQSSSADQPLDTPNPSISTRTPGGTRMSMRDLYATATTVVTGSVSSAARRSIQPLPL